MHGPDNEQLHDVHARLLAQAISGTGDLPEGGAPERSGPSVGPDVSQERFGPYALKEMLGHGGQGIVYRATDTRLGRDVALKLLSARGAATPTTRARFEREATAVSRLRHPNLCTVYEAGEIDGQRFLAMELVEGGSLTEWSTRSDERDSESRTSGERRGRVTRAFEIVEQIARAVHAAHEAGIVHRDLKPANVMLRGDGSPVVLDFGLARDEVDSDAALTMPGDQLGTPAYMPPERVQGVRSPSDPREDVYGLGAILYECLTGTRPFEGHSREQLYRRILTDRVPDPRRSNAAVPSEARHVIETALEKDPDRRYASATAFADDLGRLRRREPIRARPVPVWTRTLRWVQRDPRVAVPSLAAFTLLLAGVIVTVALLARVRTESGHTAVRALLAESATEVDRDAQLALLLVQEASRQISEDAPENLHTALRSAQIEALARARRTADFAHEGYVLAAAFTNDGERLALASDNANGPGFKIYSVAALEARDAELPVEPLFELRIDGKTPIVRSCSFDPSREWALLTTAAGVAYVVSYRDGALLHTLTPSAEKFGGFMHARAFAQFPFAGRLAAFVPGKPDQILTGSVDGLRLWQLVEGEVAAKDLWHDARKAWSGERRKGLSQMAVSTDGLLCASGAHDGWLRVMRVRDGTLLGERMVSEDAVRIMTFDPKRPLLLTSSVDDLGVQIWDVPRSTPAPDRELSRAARIPLSGTWARQVRFEPLASGTTSTTDPARLVVADDDRNLLIYAPTEGPEAFALTGAGSTSQSAFSLDFTPDRQRIVVGVGSDAVEVIDFRGRTVERLRGAVPGGVVALSPRGDRIVSTGQSERTQLWRMTDPLFAVHHLPSPVTRVSIAGSRVAIGLWNSSIGVLDSPTGRVRTARGSVSTAKPAFALSPDGMRLATGGTFGRYDLWDLSGFEPVRVPDIEDLDFQRLPLGPSGLTFDSQGNLLIAVPPGRSQDSRLVRLDTDWNVLPEWTIPGYTAYGTLIEHRGRPMLFWNRNQMIDGESRMVGQAHWDLERASVENASPEPLGLDYSTFPSVSADGSTLMLTQLGAGKGNLNFIDPERREIVRQLDLGPATDATPSSDGSRVVVPARNGQLKIWDLTTDPPRLLTELRGHEGTVWAARFSEDDQYVISGGNDGTLRFWPTDFDRLDELVEERLIRDWTDAERERFAHLLRK